MSANTFSASTPGDVQAVMRFRYIVGTSLIRLDKYLLPKQAAEYEAVINRLKERLQPQ